MGSRKREAAGRDRRSREKDQDALQVHRSVRECLWEAPEKGVEGGDGTLAVVVVGDGREVNRDTRVIVDTNYLSTSLETSKLCIHWNLFAREKTA